MKQDTGLKPMEVILVIASLVVAFFVYKGINPERFVEWDETPYSLQQVEDGVSEDFVGKVAGSDIPRLNTNEEFQELLGIECVTVEPKDIVSTGVYSLKPWESVYSTSRRGGRRRASEVVDNALLAMMKYQEYFLIQLPDDTYILAQFNQNYQEKLEKGEKITLPIGIRKTNSNTARQYLAQIGKEYDVDTTYTLYMIDNTWQEENDFTFFIIKFGAAAVVFFVLGTVFIMIYNKIRGK